MLIVLRVIDEQVKRVTISSVKGHTKWVEKVCLIYESFYFGSAISLFRQTKNELE